MNILEIISGTRVNGAIRHCLLVSRELVRRGHRVALVCRPRAWIGDQAPAHGIQVIRSDLHRWPFDELRRIGRIVREEKIDVIHTHTSRSNFFGVLVRWLTGVPSVATAHSCHIQLHWMFNDWVIAVSESTRRYQRRYNLVRNSRIETIYNAIDPAHLVAAPPETRLSMRQSLGYDAATPLLGVVGNVIPRKGLIHMVRAMPRILAAAPAARLLVVGGQEQSDYGEKVRAAAEKLGIAGSVAWTGYRGTSAKFLPRWTCSFSLRSTKDCRWPFWRRWPRGLPSSPRRWAGCRSAWFRARPVSWSRPAKAGPWPRRSSSCSGTGRGGGNWERPAGGWLFARFGLENQVNRVEGVLVRAANICKASATQPLAVSPGGITGGASATQRAA